MKYRVLSLFAGIGGIDLGLERTGHFETVAFCEKDIAARAVLSRHWPAVKQYDDVKKLSARRLHADGIFPNLIAAGSPCQDVSNSGSKAGIDGERSGLVFEFLRLVGELRPEGALLENVSALLVRGFGRILAELAALGYDAEWHCIQSANLGAPHRRDRVWLIAYPGRVGPPGPRQLVTSINPAPDAYREANRLVDAFRQRALPFVCGGHDGLSPRVDRDAIKQLGNAVDPQVPELIGRAFAAARRAAA